MNLNQKKMKHVLLIIVVIGIAAILQSNVMLLKNVEKNNNYSSNIEMPEDVKAIVDNSCYGCHNKESRNEKGKEKFKWDGLDELSKAKQVAAMEGIIEVMKEDAMPPEKFREKYPDNVPTKKDSKRLLKWADEQASKIMGE